MTRIRFSFFILIMLLTVSFCSVAYSMDYYHFELFQLSLDGFDINVPKMNIEGQLDIIGDNISIFINPDIFDKDSEKIFISGKIEAFDDNLYLQNSSYDYNLLVLWDLENKEFVFQFEGINFIFHETDNSVGIDKQLLEIDFSGYSYSDLIAIRQKIEYAFWFSKDWKKVTIPVGIYKVGVDIPAGHWTVKTLDDPNIEKTEISWGERLSDNGEDISWLGKSSVYNTVYNQNYKSYNSGNTLIQYSFEVFDGDYLIIKYSPAVFMKYEPKSLGFK